MQRHSIIGFFCEKTHQSDEGATTISGILPDTLRIAAPLPVHLPTVVLYVRMHLDPSHPPGQISIRVRFPNGGELAAGNIDRKFVEETCSDALAKNSPIAGIVSRVNISPFPLELPGRILAIAQVEEQEAVIATLNIVSLGTHALEGVGSSGEV
jgi:hypothetical protein